VLSFTAVGCPCVDEHHQLEPLAARKIFAMFGAGRLAAR
jgi:hypothetical protein